MFCPYCGTHCEESHRFCYVCGKPLPELPAAVPAAPEEAPENLTPTPVETTQTESCTEAKEITATELNEETGESPVAVDEAPQPAPVPPAPQPKKGRLWPPVLALCIMICIGMTAFFLFGSAEKEVSCFRVENGVLYFDASAYAGSDELTIPAIVDGMAVTAISDGCFQDCDRLTTIILPESVTIIGDNAFNGCDSLRGIYIPEGIVSIGSSALADCPELEAVCFPSTLAEIGEGCLNGCESLQFILYNGTYNQWRGLYDGVFRSSVELHTNDGVYYAEP